MSTLVDLVPGTRMEQIRFNYSMKNIPLPHGNSYKKKLIEKVESVIKRMRWKALFFLRKGEDDQDDETPRDEKFSLKTRKCPPQIEDMKPFENDLIKMIENVQFRKVNNNFQTTMKDDIRKIKNSKKLLIPADKTRNLYELDKAQYEKLMKDNITKSYKKADARAYDEINVEARDIATDLSIEDRMEIMAKKQAFITLKDHKENFQNNPTCRLINPAKSEIGLVSKKVLDRINNDIKSSTRINQWKNSASVIKWFENINDKPHCTFIVFDIVEFYPSITEELLMKAIDFAKRHTTITDQDTRIILHARKSLLFDKQTTWAKKNNQGMFDVTMGSYDGAEICELVGAFTLNSLAEKYDKKNIGLYRDDGLAVFKNITGSTAERIRKEITQTFHELGLRITIESNIKIVNFLDITLNLADGKYQPYRKPNDQPTYINTQSNHPPTVIKHLPAAIGRRISDISYNEETFKKAAPLYEEALKASGYNETLIYTDRAKGNEKKRNTRQRKIIWFNPPFSKNVKTNIGHTFLRLLNKHFPITSKLRKIFNQQSVKISYSCMENMSQIIKAHNKNITNNHQEKPPIACNCRKKNLCPLDGNCQTSSIIYNAQVTSTSPNSEKHYIGLTENTFKQRYTQHKSTLTHKKHQTSTELSKYIWQLKDKEQAHDVKWSITTHAAAYSNKTKRCNLCITEKLHILNADKSSLLNKRSELISKCRHENKFYLINFNSNNYPP